VTDVLRIPIQRLDRALPVPAKARPGDAGVDLRSAIDFTLNPGGRALVPTGVAVAIPPGYAGFVQPRSGMAVRHGLGIVNSPGLIDSGYRGEIKVIVINLDPTELLQVRRSDRIAQIVIVPVPDYEFVEVEDLDESERGEGGFGSTGT
jgi:dUTP pyrophosphatase